MQAATIDFTDQQIKMAALAKALGHPARVAIVEFLLKQDRCICGDIVNVLPLAQATVSQHLKALKQAGLIKGSVHGKAICYCLDLSVIGTLKNYLLHLTHVPSHDDGSCC
jgi:predicted transcriptional regulator